MTAVNSSAGAGSGSGAVLEVLGCRGSLPVSGPDFAKYGGGTSCYLYTAGDEAIILDAGNGLLNLPRLEGKRVSLLVTHAHIDHVLGFPPFLASMGAKELTVYGATNAGMTIRQKLDAYMRKPLWPVSIDIFPAKVTYVEVKEDGVPFYIGDVKVTAVPANHPGGSTIYKLEYGGKSLVYATDFEHEELPEDRKPEREEDAPMGAEIERYYTEPMESLISFAKGADLILFDGQYTPEEYVKCKTFGHSTYEMGARLLAESGAGRLVLVHHAPDHTDAFLDEMAGRFPEGLTISLAKQGDRYDII